MTEFNLSEKECNILINKIDLSKKDDRYPSLDLMGQERLKFEKGFFKEDVKEFIRLLKEFSFTSYFIKEKGIAMISVSQLNEFIDRLDKLAGEKLNEI